MATATELLDQQFLEMRWRCLSLAADFDRIQRVAGGLSVLQNDSRLGQLRRAIQILLSADSNRAEQVQMVFSDLSAAPERHPLT